MNHEIENLSGDDAGTPRSASALSPAGTQKNRAAFYVFYDKNGEVRDYVSYYLEGLKDVAGTLCVIVNGALSSDGRGNYRAGKSRL